jgi:hypothetical protein
MHWCDLFVAQHHHVHRSPGDSRTDFTYPEMLLAGMSDEQIRLVPQEGFNSIAWLFWHVARCEDVAVNAVIAERDQVLDDGGWSRRLGIERRDIGTGMTSAEVSELSQSIDLEALFAYQDAVGHRTREVIDRIDDAILSRPLASDRVDTLAAIGTFGEHAGWVATSWRPRDRSWFLWLATGHCYQHFGEAITVRTMGGTSWPA